MVKESPSSWSIQLLTVQQDGNNNENTNEEESGEICDSQKLGKKKGSRCFVVESWVEKDRDAPALLLLLHRIRTLL